MPDLPNGFDRADGRSGRLGTPEPADSVLHTHDGDTVDVSSDANASPIPIEEESSSPEIERAEQATLTHSFTMSWPEALTRIQTLGRGTVLTDSFGNRTRVLSSHMSHQGGKYARLRVVAESVSFDSPPDEFDCQPVELGVHIIKHPRYLYALSGDSDDQYQKNQHVIRALQNYFETPSPPARNTIVEQLNASIGTYDPALSDPPATTDKIKGTDLAKRAALEIIQKYWRGEETPYVVGWEVTWAAYYFRPQYLHPGGREENPITQASPALPDYFWSPSWPPSSATIFDAMAALNPQCYSSTGNIGGSTVISWLRKADTVDYQRTWFKVTRRWIGSPVGFWDPQLYTASARPSDPDHYLATSAIAIPPVK